MIQAKSFQQKAFEKIAMMKQNKGFKLMLAKSDGKFALVFCLAEGEHIIPLCKVLSQKDLDCMEPLFEESKKHELDYKFGKFLESLDGWKDFDIDDWNNTEQSDFCEDPQVSGSEFERLLMDM